MDPSARVLQVTPEDRFLLMVGYSPNVMPLRGADGFTDVAAADVVEKACWNFMLNGAKAGIGHHEGGEDAFRVVENGIYRPDTPWTFKAANGEDVTIRKGDWLIGVICREDVWNDFKKGKYGGGSIQGKVKRRIASPESIARVRSNA